MNVTTCKTNKNETIAPQLVVRRPTCSEDWRQLLVTCLIKRYGSSCSLYRTQQQQSTQGTAYSRICCHLPNWPL